MIFSRTKISTKHPWVMRIQMCSNEGPCPFPKGNNHEKLKKNQGVDFLKRNQLGPP